MTAASLILSTLQASPKSMSQLYKSVPYLGSEFALEHALHDLMQAGRAAVDLGVYRAI